MTGEKAVRIRSSPCLACGRTPCDVAHVKSRGSGGGNHEHNILPLCRAHHSMQHLYGWARFSKEFPEVLAWLTSHGWELDPHGKLTRVRNSV